MSRALDLVTERLTLRPVASEDLAFATALGADPRVMASFGGVFGSEQSAEWLARQLGHWRQRTASAGSRFFAKASPSASWA